MSFQIIGRWSYRLPSKQVSSYTKPGPFAYSGMVLFYCVYIKQLYICTWKGIFFCVQFLFS